MAHSAYDLVSTPKYVQLLLDSILQCLPSPIPVERRIVGAAAANLAQTCKTLPPMAVRMSNNGRNAHLIGQEPDLLLQGGGKISVKTHSNYLFGYTHKTIHIKGSRRGLAGTRLATKRQPSILGDRSRAAPFALHDIGYGSISLKMIRD